MHLKFRNVNTAFRHLVFGISQGGIKTRTEQTRNGPVIQIDEPVTITYEKPTERVLFNSERDANPFFHLYEALWMLSGRNDVAPLAYYAPNVANYSDDEKTFNGAYGYRWRHSNGERVEYDTGIGVIGEWEVKDQLKILIDHLKRIPGSRRAVLQMWNVEDDLLKIDNSKDVCCNLSVLFSIRETEEHTNDWDCSFPTNKYRYLDITITNRSNDLVWGSLGANYVHFSFLQEYMAAQLGVEVGLMHVFSNNLHVYTENNSGFKPELWLSDEIGDAYTKSAASNLMFVPLVRDPVMFDKELYLFVEMNSGKGVAVASKGFWAEPFFALVAQPMLTAFHHHKQREYHSALAACMDIHATDWRIAATNWIKKRRQNYESKQAKMGE